MWWNNKTDVKWATCRNTLVRTQYIIWDLNCKVEIFRLSIDAQLPMDQFFGSQYTRKIYDLIENHILFSSHKHNLPNWNRQPFAPFSLSSSPFDICSYHWKSRSDESYLATPSRNIMDHMNEWIAHKSDRRRAVGGVWSRKKKKKKRTQGYDDDDVNNQCICACPYFHSFLSCVSAHFYFISFWRCDVARNLL